MRPILGRESWLHLRKKMWATREALQGKIESDAAKQKLKREVQMSWGRIKKKERKKKFGFIGSEVLLKITIL